MSIRAVIFDLDETLLDRRASLKAFLVWQTKGMLKPYLKDPEEFMSRFVELDGYGRVWKDVVYQRLIEEFDIKGWRSEELLSVYELSFCGFSISRPGVEEAIDKLADRYGLGLISNGKTPFQERNFRALGYSEKFASIVVSGAVGLRKPEPEIFQRGCSELDVRPEEAVFVGDSPDADIKGAREAGMKTVFVPSELTPLCVEADAVCGDMSGLPDLIGRLA